MTVLPVARVIAALLRTRVRAARSGRSRRDASRRRRISAQAAAQAVRRHDGAVRKQMDVAVLSAAARMGCRITNTASPDCNNPSRLGRNAGANSLPRATPDDGTAMWPRRYKLE